MSKSMRLTKKGYHPQKNAKKGKKKSKKIQKRNIFPKKGGIPKRKFFPKKGKNPTFFKKGNFFQFFLNFTFFF